MNRIRFSTASQSNTFDMDGPKSSCASHEDLLSVGSKLKIPRDNEDFRARQIRWERINGDREQQNAPPHNGDQRPTPFSA